MFWICSRTWKAVATQPIGRLASKTRESANARNFSDRGDSTVTRRGPEPDAKRYPDHRPSKLRPTDTAYWEQHGDRSFGIGHVFKYPYSYYNLMQRVDDPALKRDWEAKAYHVF
jgi:hypothetical protein